MAPFLSRARPRRRRRRSTTSTRTGRRRDQLGETHPPPRPLSQTRRSRPILTSGPPAENGNLMPHHSPEVQERIVEECKDPGKDIYHCQ